MKQYVGWFVVGVVLLSGCATVPPAPSFQLSSGDRVGIIVDVGEGPAHTHVGTTIFNNFTKQCDYDWGLEAAIVESFTRSLSASGFEVVDLKAQGYSHAQLTALVDAKNGGWAVSPERDEIVSQLLETENLRSVVVIGEDRVLAALECGAFGCVDRAMDAPGVFTRSILGLTGYTAVAAIDMNVYVLEPPVDLAQLKPLVGKMNKLAVPLPDYRKPEAFKNITLEEFEPVKLAIVDIVDKLSSEAASALTPMQR